MRIDVKVLGGKKKDAIGLGLVAGFLALFAIGYGLGAPAIASVFPPKVERALTNLRNEIDGATEGLRRRLSNTYHTIAGRG